MKNLFILILVISFPLLFNGQIIEEKKISTDISFATVYLNSAEISRVTNITLKKGQTLLIFEGLSTVIDDKSVRVTIGNDIDILQISTSINYLIKENDKPQIKILNDSLEIIKISLQVYTDELDAYRIEKDLLLSNMEIGGSNNGVSIDELKATADYYRSRIMEINKKVTKISQLSQKYQLDKNRIQNQLNELNAKSSYSRKEVRILVESNKTINTDLTLKYMVNFAGWSPVYDLKAKDTDSPISLVYRAKVFNNTGIDWENITLTLSTNDASVSNSKPILSTSYLREVATVYGNMYKGTGYVQQSNQPVQAPSDFGGKYNVSDDEISIDFEYEAVVPVLSHEFEITKKYSVPADDKPYLVYISEKELDADYKHYAVTKLDPGVFLLAQITGWEDLNLIDGPANVYYAGSYIGKSFISTRNVSDTLDFSLGRDNKVIVTRHKINKYNSSQLIGNKKKTTFAYSYELKNNHKTAIDIVLSDQIPVSESDDIEVKIIEISNGEVNETTGEVVWKVHLQPGELKKIEFTFSVKYPKNISVPMTQSKSQNIRYFN